MTSRSEPDRALRRLRPDRRRSAFARRPDAELAYAERGPPFPPKLLLDATVYIDALQGRAGDAVELTLRACDLWHTSVAAAELALALGRLDPADPRTGEATAQCRRALERIPEHKVLTPDDGVWREAGVAAGILARTQGYGRDARPRVLNDALILLTARKHGCAVLTRNVAEFRRAVAARRGRPGRLLPRLIRRAGRAIAFEDWVARSGRLGITGWHRIGKEAVPWTSLRRCSRPWTTRGRATPSATSCWRS